MTITPAEAALLPLSDDDAILERVDDLIGAACGRAVWMIFLDDRDIQLPVLIPVDGYPALPGDDVGELAHLVGATAEMAEAASVVLVWEREGGSRSTAADRAWAKAAALGLARRDVALRGQLISHDGGVRWFAPDDYL